jgi:hypothetical protein
MAFVLSCNQCGKGLGIVGIGVFDGNAEVFEGIGEQFDGAAVQGRSSDDFITGTGEVDEGKGNSRSAGSRSQGSCAAFQCGNPFFQDIPGRVGQAGINEARFLSGRTGLRHPVYFQIHSSSSDK